MRITSNNLKRAFDGPIESLLNTVYDDIVLASVYMHSYCSYGYWFAGFLHVYHLYFSHKNISLFSIIITHNLLSVASRSRSTPRQEGPEVEILLSRIRESIIRERRRVFSQFGKMVRTFFFHRLKNLLSRIRESRILLSRNLGKVYCPKSTIILDLPVASLHSEFRASMLYSTT